MNPATAQDPIHPRLTAEQIEVLSGFGEERHAVAGEDLFCSDDERHDMFVVLSGLVGVISSFDGADELVIHHTAGELVGELDLLTGQRSYLGARMLLEGDVLALAPAAMRRVIATAPRHRRHHRRDLRRPTRATLGSRVPRRTGRGVPPLTRVARAA